MIKGDSQQQQKQPALAKEPSTAAAGMKAVTDEDRLNKPYTCQMTPKERWKWAFRMIMQVLNQHSLILLLTPLLLTELLLLYLALFCRRWSRRILEF